MQQDTTFTYSYCAKDNKEVEDIRKKYLPREESEMEELRRLDKTVQSSAKAFSYILGGISAIIMGGGMSLVMTDIGTTLGLESTMIPGVVIGVVGLFMAVINYPIYKSILGSRRRKYADKIIALSDKIMKGQGEL